MLANYMLPFSTKVCQRTLRCPEGIPKQMYTAKWASVGGGLVASNHIQMPQANNGQKLHRMERILCKLTLLSSSSMVCNTFNTSTQRAASSLVDACGRQDGKQVSGCKRGPQLCHFIPEISCFTEAVAGMYVRPS